MPSFKPKPFKKIVVPKKDMTTVDSKHNELMESFYKDETQLVPKLMSDLRKLEDRLAKCDTFIKTATAKTISLTATNTISKSIEEEEKDISAQTSSTKKKAIGNKKKKKKGEENDDDNDILLESNMSVLTKKIPIVREEMFELEDQIKALKKQIGDLKKQKTEYFLNNSKFIFPYFENKKNIAEGNNRTKTLNSFFNLTPEAQQNETLVATTQDMTTASSWEDEQDKDVFKPNQDLEQIDPVNYVRRYLSNVDESFIDSADYITKTGDLCCVCGEGELIPQDDEELLMCNNCYHQVNYLIDNDKPSYKEPPKEVCFYAYQRINHFREILAQFQAKETTQIPTEVIDNIKNQIKKERIDLPQLTEKKMKEILKQLGYSKYYEHIAFIKCKLGIKPPVMSPELEETLYILFMELQGPYAKHCPDYRTNFLSYRYTVYKLCELLGETQFLPFLTLLKNDMKIIEQDQVWKLICDELEWEFIPTI